MLTKKISTTIGTLSGRDAIYIDELKQVFAPSIVTLKGKINGSLCSSNIYNLKWINYKFTFRGVKYFDCCHLDSCKIEVHLSSSFDIVNNSEQIKTLGLDSKYIHIIVSTYDYIYQIICLPDYSQEFNV